MLQIYSTPSTDLQGRQQRAASLAWERGVPDPYDSPELRRQLNFFTRLLKAMKNTSVSFHEDNCNHQFWTCFSKCHHMFNISAWLPQALGSTAKERMHGKHSQLLTTQWSHPQITAFWRQHWASWQAESMTCQKQCFTLYYGLPELPHTTCVEAAGMPVIIFPSKFIHHVFLHCSRATQPQSSHHHFKLPLF